MKKNRFIMMAALVAVLAGCSKSTYYQVYQTQPVDENSVVNNNGKLQHDAGKLVVSYNFFAENGDGGFWLTNNSDSIIYVNLAESFFIVDGQARDYYQDREWTTTKSSTITLSKREGKTRNGKKNKEKTEGSSTTSVNASTFNERSMIMVPPHSTKYFTEFSICNTVLEMCGVKDTPKKSRPDGKTFTLENTPLTFGNFITYTVGSKGKAQHVSDNFFVSQVINVNGDAMFEMVRLKDACGKEKGDKVEQHKYATPDRFFVKYKK